MLPDLGPLESIVMGLLPAFANLSTVEAGPILFVKPASSRPAIPPYADAEVSVLGSEPPDNKRPPPSERLLLLWGWP